MKTMVEAKHQAWTDRRRRVIRAIRAWTARAGSGTVLMALLSAPAHSQERLTGADLAGQVSDESGAVLHGAAIAAVNADTNVARMSQTDDHGHFRIPSLAPGTYRVTIDHRGFTSQVRDGLVLLLGQTLVLDITMKIASMQEQVTVSADARVTYAGHTAISSVVGQQQIQDLPINGRNFISFSTMTPGVTTDRTPQQGATATSGLSFAGQRARSNNIMVDGLDNNDPATGAVRAAYSQEAVREFRVLTNAYSAEFGKASSGVVNIVTKSGTNVLHGTAFGYLRDETLNAKDHFERFDRFGDPIDREKAPFGQLQWGGVVGGPIRKDRTFVFASFEKMKLAANNFVNIDSQVVSVLSANGFPVELGNVPYDVLSTTVLGKIDHHFSPVSTLAVRAAFSDTTNENIEPFGGLVARSRGAAEHRDDASLSASQINVFSGRWVNEARFQFAHQDLRVESLDPRCIGPCDDPLDGGPTLELPGVASVGRQRFTPQVRSHTRSQFIDTVSFLARDHSVKAGLEFNHISYSTVELPLHFGGRFIFAPLPALPNLGLIEPLSAVQALARGVPAAYIQGYGNPRAPFAFQDLSAFLQDDWRIGGRLTIRLGVRYQRQFWPDVPFDVSNAGGGRLQYTLPQDGDNIAPRVAVAFDPTGKGRTSLHAAYGRYYDNHHLATAATGQIINGTAGVRTLALRLPGSITAWNAPGHRLPEPASPFPSVEVLVGPDIETPYAHHLAAGIDHLMAPDLSLAANLVFVEGQHQIGPIDYNPIVPALGPGRRPNDIDSVPGTSASVLQYTAFGETWYRGLTVSLTKRFSRRHQFLVAYTFSQAEDTSTDFQSAFVPEDNGFGRDPGLPAGLPLGFDPRRERGPATHDQRHRLVLSGVYRFPLDIQGSAVITAASGRPFTALAGTNLNGDGDGGAFPPDRARRDPRDAATSVGRNGETMPAQITVDARLSKRVALPAGVELEAIVEAFNLLNRTNFSEANGIFGPGAFPTEPQRDSRGRVTYGLFEQALPPRQVQLALRFSF